MSSIDQELARRDRYRNRLNWALTPEERLRRMERLQERAFALLRSNPEAYAHFIRRNFKARAIEVQNENGG